MILVYVISHVILLQGMDAENERFAFQQILKAHVGPDAPQGFLITPKLQVRERLL